MRVAFAVAAPIVALPTPFPRGPSLTSPRSSPSLRPRACAGRTPPPTPPDRPGNKGPGLVGGLPLWAATAAVSKLFNARAEHVSRAARRADPDCSGGAEDDDPAARAAYPLPERLRQFAGEFEAEECALRSALRAERHRVDVLEKRLEAAEADAAGMRQWRDGEVRRVAGETSSTARLLFEELCKAQVRAAKAEHYREEVSRISKLVGKERDSVERDTLAIASLGLLATLAVSSFFLHSTQSGDVAHRVLHSLLGDYIAML